MKNSLAAQNAAQLADCAARQLASAAKCERQAQELINGAKRQRANAAAALEASAALSALAQQQSIPPLSVQALEVFNMWSKEVD